MRITPLFTCLRSASCAVITMASVLAAPPRERPNIVFILADDLGYTDLSCMGSRYYETPNIDRLAREGMQFTNFHQAANCAPSRACMMTGQYPPRTGIYTVGTLERGAAERRKMDVPENVTDLPLDRQTIGDVLTAAGYRTAYFGKWDLGEGGFHPARRGFEEAVVVHGPHFGFRSDPPLPVEAGQIDGDWLTDRAEEFIERPRAEPFFLFLAHKLPHAPQQAKHELEAKYRRKPAVGGHNHSTYAAMIESLDQSVGRILAKVHALGLTRETVIFFASDNGGTGMTDNAPLRGGKGQHYEGGLRVPFLVRRPGVTNAGTKCDALTVHVDVFATLVELAGAAKPRHETDGISLVPYFRNPRLPSQHDAIFGHLPGYLERTSKRGGPWRTTPVGHIISGDWKLLEFFEDDRLELYDLRGDPGEQFDLAARFPDQARALRGRLAAWRASVGAAMPIRKSPSHAASGASSEEN